MKVENAAQTRTAAPAHRATRAAQADPAARAGDGAAGEGDFAALVGQIAGEMGQPTEAGAAADSVTKVAMPDAALVDHLAARDADPVAGGTLPAGAGWLATRADGTPSPDSSATATDSPGTGESVETGMVLQDAPAPALDTTIAKPAKPGGHARIKALETQAQAAPGEPDANAAPQEPVAVEADAKPRKPVHHGDDKTLPAEQTAAQAQIDAQAAAPVAAAIAGAAAAPQPVAAPVAPSTPAPSARNAGPVAAAALDPSAGATARNVRQGQAETDADTSGNRGAFARAERAQRKAAELSPATGDIATDAKDAGAALRDIVQSLPPVVQSQLPVVDSASASAVPTVSAGQQLDNQVVDMAVSGQWIDRMAREIAGLADGTGHSRFQLSPPHLGRIQVDLWQGDNATHLRMTTETDEAARRLRDGQSMLEADARVAALSLGSVTVEKSSAAFESRDQGGNQGQRQASDFGGQAQQQGAFAQGRSGGSQGALNRGGSPAVMGSDRASEPAIVPSASRTAERRVRYA